MTIRIELSDPTGKQKDKVYSTYASKTEVLAGYNKGVDYLCLVDTIGTSHVIPKGILNGYIFSFREE